MATMGNTAPFVVLQVDLVFDLGRNNLYAVYPTLHFMALAYVNDEEEARASIAAKIKKWAPRGHPAFLVAVPQLDPVPLQYIFAPFVEDEAGDPWPKRVDETVAFWKQVPKEITATRSTADRPHEVVEEMRRDLVAFFEQKGWPLMAIPTVAEA